MTPLTLFGREYAMTKHYLHGTHRARSPQDTLADYARWMPHMGITRLANLTGLDTIGLPVYTAIRPNARSVVTTPGQGLDTASARVSALMASIERWHGEYLAQPLRWESYLALRQTAPVVDVTALLLRPDSELYLDRPLLWIEGYDLMQQQALWVPFEAVSVNSVASPASTLTFYQSSNGLAAGNHLLEAVVHGLCEVMERDATALWHLHDDLQQLDLSTVEDPCCQQVLDLLAQADVCIAVWDITSDLGIPTYGCTIFDRPDHPSGRLLGSYNGFGCHLSPAIALMRALTEAVQSRVTYIAGSRDDCCRDTYTQQEDTECLQALWEVTSAPACPISFAAQPSLAAESFEADIHTVLAALRQGGSTSAIVVDLSKPDIDIPVVKVIVPGLEGPLGCRPGPRAAQLREEAGA